MTKKWSSEYWAPSWPHPINIKHRFKR